MHLATSSAFYRDYTALTEWCARLSGQYGPSNGQYGHDDGQYGPDNRILHSNSLPLEYAHVVTPLSTGRNISQSCDKYIYVEDNTRAFSYRHHIESEWSYQAEARSAEAWYDPRTRYDDDMRMLGCFSLYHPLSHDQCANTLFMTFPAHSLRAKQGIYFHKCPFIQKCPGHSRINLSTQCIPMVLMEG